MDYILDTIMSRFVIEPRGQSKGGWSCKTWLVVYDKVIQDYLSIDKAYRKFKNSNEVFDFLKQYIKEGN